MTWFLLCIIFVLISHYSTNGRITPWKEYDFAAGVSGWGAFTSGLRRSTPSSSSSSSHNSTVRLNMPASQKPKQRTVLHVCKPQTYRPTSPPSFLPNICKTCNIWSKLHRAFAWDYTCIVFVYTFCTHFSYLLIIKHLLDRICWISWSIYKSIRFFFYFLMPSFLNIHTFMYKSHIHTECRTTQIK